MGWKRPAISIACLLLATSILIGAPPETRHIQTKQELPPATSQSASSFDIAAASLGPTFKRNHSAHFEMISDVDAGTVRRVLDLSEDTFRAVKAFADRMELAWSLPTERMPLILMESYTRYAAYGRQLGFVADQNVPGFFDEASGACVMFCFSNATLIRSRRDELWRHERVLAELIRRNDQTSRSRAAELMSSLNEAKRNIAAAERAVLATVVRHEIAHQVMFHTGIQTKSMRGRRWLSEGLAMQFENTDGPNEYRMSDVLSIPPFERRDLLQRVVSDSATLGPGAGEASRAYAAAWALVYYLSHEQPQALASYVKMPPTYVKEIDAFERRFGELNAEFVERLFVILEEQQN